MDLFFSIFLITVLYSSVKIIEHKRKKEIKEKLNKEEVYFLKSIGFFK